MSTKSLVIFLVSLYQVQSCYWNSLCPYALYGSKTPYNTVRGDIRDYPTPENCEAVSIWTLNRHGNRNPTGTVSRGMKQMSDLKDEIVASYEAGNSKLCCQDIEDFKNWNWNDTIDVSHSYLTGVGYEELYGIGKRIREKYPDLLDGGVDEFYFRPTNEQRTITSCNAFVQGFTRDLDLHVTVDAPRSKDDVIRPYGNCDRYQRELQNGEILTEQLDKYFHSEEYIAVQNAVQDQLGLKTPLDSQSILSIYELCRFYRSWTDVHRSPWCAVFSRRDLLVLEYYDDIRHYYKNGHGSPISAKLGKMALKDLYDNFEAVVDGKGKRLTSYFTHDTMIEMTLSAMGLYQEDEPVQGTIRKADRVWRSSFIAAFSSNLIAVLTRCNIGNGTVYKVQLFVNEKETEICPVDGCSWQEFQDKFQIYSEANLDFCSMNHKYGSKNPASVNQVLN